MKYRMVRHGVGDYADYAVLDVAAGALVIEHESMSVCNAFLYLNPPSEAAEVRAAYEAAKLVK